jgi:hypothetical protein
MPEPALCYARRKKRVFKSAAASRASTSCTGSDAENSYARPVVSPRTRTGAFSRYEMAMSDPSGAVPAREICAWAGALTRRGFAPGAVPVRSISILRRAPASGRFKVAPLGGRLFFSSVRFDPQHIFQFSLSRLCRYGDHIRGFSQGVRASRRLPRARAISSASRAARA